MQHLNISTYHKSIIILQHNIEIDIAWFQWNSNDTFLEGEVWRQFKQMTVAEKDTSEISKAVEYGKP